MLQVFPASFCDFLSDCIGREWLHTTTKQGLAAEVRSVGLAMRNHDHVTVVDAIALLPMNVLCLIDELPVLGQVLKGEQIAL